MNARFQQRLIAVLIVAFISMVWTAPSAAQFGGPPDTRSARERALIDISGQWVAVINEDWRWRMITAPVGDTLSIPTTAAARKVAADWDLERDKAEGNLCRAFGAAGIMRQPTRIRIDWQDDNTLEFEFDAGRQKRLLHFAASDVPAEHTLQGFSQASWYRQRVARGVLGSGNGLPGGALHVRTTKLAPGYLRPNGVPYSDQTTMKEYIQTFTLPDGDSWLIFTSIIQDPMYLSQELILSTQFKKESSRKGWNPRDCDIQPPRVERPPTVPGPFG